MGRCRAGGPADHPTVNNIDTLNLTGGSGDSTWFLLDPASLAPGNSGTDNEIGITALLGGGNDGINVLGTGSDDFWILGNTGANWNGDMDTDASLTSGLSGVEAIALGGLVGNDAITALGDPSSGAAYAGTAQLVLVGGEGNDVLEASNTNDLLSGNEGNDDLQGEGGSDELSGGEGTNVLTGGSGDDLADYLIASTGVTVNLNNAGGTQNTGYNVDTLSGIEGLSGSNRPDTLIGDGAANRLLGQDENDTLDGRGGNDELNGGAGINTATYAQAPAGVNVDLFAGTATGGAGNDTLTGIANLTGSPFADALIGDAQNSSILALGGNDTVAAGAGADDVNVRDGGPDTASCGTEIDTATADQASVDSVNADCENVSFLPEPNGGGGGGGGDLPPGPGDTGVSFDLSGKSKQRIVEQKGVIVKASCPLEDCSATAAGTAKAPKPKRAPLAKLNLKPVTEALAAGVAERIKLRLKRRQLRAVARALRAGKKPKVTVTAQVTDAAGNAVADRLVVRAKR